MADEYACFVSEFDCSDQKCQKLFFKSWQVLLQVNPVCENYWFYKHWLEHERYLKTIWVLEKIAFGFFIVQEVRLCIYIPYSIETLFVWRKLGDWNKIFD